jgi:hypothetical protein
MVNIPRLWKTYSGSLRTISKSYLNYLKFSSDYIGNLELVATTSESTSGFANYQITNYIKSVKLKVNLIKLTLNR